MIDHPHLPRQASGPPALPLRAVSLHTIQFTGSGSAYFRIWVVNLLLTVVTLGLYHPWAKVRKLQYFYGNFTGSLREAYMVFLRPVLWLTGLLLPRVILSAMLPRTLGGILMAVLALQNWVLIILTLGLYWPFAAVANARARLQAIVIHTRQDPDLLVGQARGGTQDAAGDMASDLIGLDIGM
jgi:uncharacterized membrane protein YjgN (DUF898 family)